MSFLQSGLLWALPVIAIPILIHLINQSRHQKVEWGAMQFLLKAKKMNQGMVRLKQWLILAMRVLALLGLILVLSRPLIGGWVGKALGGVPEVILVLLDRSASMEEIDQKSGLSKRETALNKIADALNKTNSSSRVVLIDSATLQPIEIEKASNLLTLPETKATSTETSIPRLLEIGLEYLKDNQVGRSDVWICSDHRANDWDENDNRWSALKEEYEAIPGVQLSLLSYPDVSNNNREIIINQVSLDNGTDNNLLILDFEIRGYDQKENKTEIPVTFTINGSRTVHKIPLQGLETKIFGHQIPLGNTAREGWGKIELPADSNGRDNVAFFVFSEEQEVLVTVIAENREVAEVYQKAALASPNQNGLRKVDVLEEFRASEIVWNESSFIIWQAPLPKGVIAEQVTQFIQSGKSILFLAPRTPSKDSFLGVTWGEWNTHEGNEKMTPSWWRNDSLLLRDTDSGYIMPLSNLEINKWCEPTISAEDGLSLMQLDGGKIIWTKAKTNIGHAWFCGIYPLLESSSLLEDGVAFYVSLQRAIELGATASGKTQVRELNLTDELSDKWEVVEAIDSEANSDIEKQLLAGVFRLEDQTRAYNRPKNEGTQKVLSVEKIQEIFGDLKIQMLLDEAGQKNELVREIWRVFIYLVALALLAEALLSLPGKSRAQKSIKKEGEV